MTEERLRTVIREGLDSLPLPARFSSPSQLMGKSPPPRRRLTWMISAAAAVFLAVALGVSPVGKAVARAVTSWFVTDTKVWKTPDYLQHLRNEETTERIGSVMDLQPGQSLQHPPEAGPNDDRTIYEAKTIAELLQDSTNLPLPGLLTPSPETKVVVSRLYTGQTVVYTALQIPYTVRLGKKEYRVFYYFVPAATPRTETEVAALVYRDYVFADNVKDVQKQKITLKGRDGTAMSSDGGKTWTIRWFSTTGSGWMYSDMPLKEMVRIVESIPTP
jgi:hypothetical protein